MLELKKETNPFSIHCSMLTFYTLFCLPLCMCLILILTSKELIFSVTNLSSPKLIGTIKYVLNHDPKDPCYMPSGRELMLRKNSWVQLPLLVVNKHQPDRSKKPKNSLHTLFQNVYVIYLEVDARLCSQKILI